MPKVEEHWKYANGGYARADGTTLVRHKHSAGAGWWVHIAGHDTPLQIRGQPHLRRYWSTAVAAMRAANKEYPLQEGASASGTRRPQSSGARPQKPPAYRRPKRTSSTRSSRHTGGLIKSDPFVFIGHGFGTSHKCLECYLWFERAPDTRRQRTIASLLPAPVAVFARFRGELLHFGSDDTLEERIKAAYGKAPAAPVTPGRPREAAPAEQEPVPTRQEWRRFCDDFERAVKAIHRVCKLVAVVKPDDGTYGKRLSPWHRRSVADAARLVVRAAEHAQNQWVAALAMNLIEDVLPTWNAAMRLSDLARQSWLRWLDALIAKRRADPDLTSELIERATWLYGTAPAETRSALLESMRPGARKQILAKTRHWKR